MVECSGQGNGWDQRGMRGWTLSSEPGGGFGDGGSGVLWSEPWLWSQLIERVNTVIRAWWWCTMAVMWWWGFWWWWNQRVMRSFDFTEIMIQPPGFILSARQLITSEWRGHYHRTQSTVHKIDQTFLFGYTNMFKSNTRGHSFILFTSYLLQRKEGKMVQLHQTMFYIWRLRLVILCALHFAWKKHCYVFLCI